LTTICAALRRISRSATSDRLPIRYLPPGMLLALRPARRMHMKKLTLKKSTLRTLSAAQLAMRGGAVWSDTWVGPLPNYADAPIPGTGNLACVGGGPSILINTCDP
jgi:hypothetical protein